LLLKSGVTDIIFEKCGQGRFFFFKKKQHFFGVLGSQNVKIHQNLSIDSFHQDDTFPIGKVKIHVLLWRTGSIRKAFFSFLRGAVLTRLHKLDLGKSFLSKKR